jgi:hypothetical protein
MWRCVSRKSDDVLCTAVTAPLFRSSWDWMQAHPRGYAAG